MTRHCSNSIITRCLCGTLVLLCAGCGTSRVDFQANEVYRLLQETDTRIELSEQQRQDIADILEFWLGTPNEPRIPSITGVDLESVLSPSRLEMAAGPTRSDESGKVFGAYRKHCAVCHGISGDGVGPAAAFLNPYPRDFRRGIFKYKSTAGPVTPPTDEDLRKILLQGMPGTSMPAFHLLDETEIDSLIDYVKYLAIRGEIERALIVESVDVLDGPDDRLVDGSLQEDEIDDFEESLVELEPLVAYVARDWTQAASRVTSVPPAPDDWMTADAIKRGRELYLGEVANCVKCHGKNGDGEAEQIDYDDWTKETFDAQHPEKHRPYRSLGALRPRPIEARDFRDGIFRGGADPEDLYLRILNGIGGTPMPAAPMKSDDAAADDIRLSSRDVWCLVQYVMSLADASGEPIAETE